MNLAETVDGATGLLYHGTIKQATTGAAITEGMSKMTTKAKDEELKDEAAPTAVAPTTWTLPEAIKLAMIAEAAPILSSVKLLDERLTTVRGNVAEQRKAARLACIEAEGAPVHGAGPELPFAYATFLTDQIEALKNELEDIEQSCEAAVMAWLKAKHDDTTTEVSTLLEQRKVLVGSLSAMSALGIELDIPAAPKVGRSSSTGPRVASKTGRCYVVNGSGTHKMNPEYASGERAFTTNSSLSYIAWQFKVSIAELRKAMTDAGVTNEIDEWECTLTLIGKDDKSRTMTVGHEITSN